MLCARQVRVYSEAFPLEKYKTQVQRNQKEG